jgi:ribonuclease E
MSTESLLINYKNYNDYQVVGLDKKEKICNFDFVTENQRSLKSNLYLAKVVRIEHSLQAAFVDYGEEKSGFLSFSEIHPSYYQIPEFDKKKIQDEILQEQLYNQSLNDHIIDTNEEEEPFDVSKGFTFHKRYSIQEVVKKGQMLLVQATKDERGNKGVSFSTYITFAGRYCVFMPNSANGIGVSRKIESQTERRRLLEVAKTCKIPKEMSLIIRTAGVNASEADIKRDYSYLANLWKQIRKKTLEAKKVCLIYQEIDLLEQILRDKYVKKNINRVLVNTNEGFERVKKYMKELMPNEIKKIKLIHGDLFGKYGIYDKLSELTDPIVNLASGGYLVINQAEALTAIDINSGKATSEKDVESTALKTNLEAAEEIAKQIQLRGIGGLIVVDFIDMSALENRKEIERVTRNAFKEDRSRIQFSRISQFGLMEISRQRMQASVLEMSTNSCPACKGNGRMRSPLFIAREILSKLEEILLESKQLASNKVEFHVDKMVKKYLITECKKDLHAIETKHNIIINIQDAQVMNLADYYIKSHVSDGEKPRGSLIFYKSLKRSDGAKRCLKTKIFNIFRRKNK